MLPVANRSYDEDLDLVAFIEMRRDLSAMRPVWALCEFSLGIDLPNSVMEHPSILKLSELANDVVSWTNVRSLSRLSHAF